MSFESDLMFERRRLRRRLILWQVAAIVAAVTAALVVLYRTLPFGALQSRDHVARIEITGLITENRWIEDQIAGVARNGDAKALIVYVNSPGGSTYGGEVMFRALRRVAEVKPVVAVIGTLGTSAGYMVAVAANRVLARETSITGSIGVLYQAPEFSKLMEKLGISAQTVRSGPYKDEPSMFHPMTETGRLLMQQMVDESHRWFVALVAERRNLPIERAGALADGRILSGKAAKDAGLIDALGGEREAREWLKQTHGIDPALPVTEIPRTPPLQRWRRLVGETTANLLEKAFLSERLTLDGLVSVWHPDL